MLVTYNVIWDVTICLDLPTCRAFDVPGKFYCCIIDERFLGFIEVRARFKSSNWCTRAIWLLIIRYYMFGVIFAWHDSSYFLVVHWVGLHTLSCFYVCFIVYVSFLFISFMWRVLILRVCTAFKLFSSSSVGIQSVMVDAQCLVLYFPYVLGKLTIWIHVQVSEKCHHGSYFEKVHCGGRRCFWGKSFVVVSYTWMSVFIIILEFSRDLA